ncbi:MAG: PAS domain-containing protein [Halieaceae bacterium]|nr:PAS domain-containing protein [Halieaceae bacterium]MCP4842229.1 PAS domain-containing protein [Halieaceae bacterium]
MDEKLKPMKNSYLDLVSLDEMFQSTPSCLKVINSRGELLHMNPQGLALAGAEDMKSVFRANVYDMLAPEHRDNFIRFNQQVCSGERGSLVFEMISLQGYRRWMESYAGPYRLESGELAHIAITNDISDRVEAEKEIVEKRQALVNSSRLAVLGEFVGGIAHEINNPLAIISGKLDLLDMYLESEELDKKTLKKNVREVIETTDRISKIIHNLKTFSRDSDKDDFQDCCLEKIIEELLSLCAENLRLNDIDITYQIEPEIHVFCKEVQISQVMMNLINNACDAVMETDVRWIKILGRRIGGLVELSVSDSGRGVPENVEEKIFDPFFTTKEMGKGTGLGLSISSSILSQHNGKLIHRKDSINTQFVLQLPLSA